MTPEDLKARLLYRDGLMLALDKPAGLPVHRGPGGGPSLEDLFDALRFGLPKPPALAHRLDRDTSGCLVLGRHRKALRRLGALFAEGKVKKTYWAVVAGQPPAAQGRLSRPLRKLASRRAGWRMVADPQGQAAVTEWRLRGRAGGIAWLELRPLTGRTHQLRVHCVELGCPILGDPLYGGQADRAQAVPLQLHARSLVVPLYPARAPIHIEAPVPPHMRAALEACGWRDEQDVTDPQPVAK